MATRKVFPRIYSITLRRVDDYRDSLKHEGDKDETTKVNDLTCKVSVFYAFMSVYDTLRSQRL